VTAGVKTLQSPAKLAAASRRMGRAISKDFAGHTVHVVAILEDAMVFASDLIRHITCPVVCHFVRSQVHEVTLGGYTRREVFFSHEPKLKGKDVLLVDAMLDTGITMDFLSRRLLESNPRSLRIAVLLDRPSSRRVALKADYKGFDVDSGFVVGYGLAGPGGLYRNLPALGLLDGRRRAARKRKA
jgi:hypoxanthine phosphoribosyltransferase